MTNFKELVENAAKLAERAIPAFNDQQKLKEIEPLYDEAIKKAELLEKKTSDEREAFRTGLNKIADTLVTRGILDNSNKVAFVNSISEKPTEIFNVLDKIASELKAESFGQPSNVPSSPDLDPFERLVVEG
jgi:hypothetical protein